MFELSQFRGFGSDVFVVGLRTKGENDTFDSVGKLCMLPCNCGEFG